MRWQTLILAIALSSCGMSDDTVKETLSIEISDEELLDLKEELQQIAEKNGLLMVDGSDSTITSREKLRLRYQEIHGQTLQNDVAHNIILNVVLEYQKEHENFIVMIYNIGTDQGHINVTFVYDETSAVQKDKVTSIKDDLQNSLNHVIRD